LKYYVTIHISFAPSSWDLTDGLKVTDGQALF